MSAVQNVATLIALDVTFAMATGVTGIHGLIIDGGASLGDALGIEPWFDAHAGHDHAANDAVLPEGCHKDYIDDAEVIHCGAHNDTLEM